MNDYTIKRQCSMCGQPCYQIAYVDHTLVCVECFARVANVGKRFACNPCPCGGHPDCPACAGLTDLAADKSNRSNDGQTERDSEQPTHLKIGGVLIPITEEIAPLVVSPCPCNGEPGCVCQ